MCMGQLAGFIYAGDHRNGQYTAWQKLEDTDRIDLPRKACQKRLSENVSERKMFLLSAVS